MPPPTAPFQDNDFCFACGALNPLGLQLSFYRDGPRLCTRVVPSAHWQGWRGVMHGGIQATIFDDLMSNHFFRLRLCVVTVELTTRFRQPVPLDRELLFSAETVSHKGRIWEARSAVRLYGSALDSRPLSEASGRFMEVPRPV